MRIDLGDDGISLLDAIIDGEDACSMVAGLEADGHAPATIARLEAGELVVRWDRPDGQALTLTPWGRFIRDVDVLERPATVQEEEDDHDKRGKRIKVKVERDDVELFWGKENPTRPYRMPYRRRQYSMPVPELVPDPAPGPEYVLNDDGKPLELFAALFTGTGFKVEVDCRLGGAKTKKGGGRKKAAVVKKRRRAG